MLAKFRRFEAIQRFQGALSAALQTVLFVAFLVVAVVLGRGGNFEAIAAGDWRAALGGLPADGVLHIDDVHIVRRTVPAGFDVVVVTGVVENTGSVSVPGVRVNARFADGAEASGWVGATIDGTDVDALRSPDEVTALSNSPPGSIALAGASQLPFVVVLGQVPAENARIDLDLVIGAPPPPPPPPPPVAPPVEPPTRKRTPGKAKARPTEGQVAP